MKLLSAVHFNGLKKLVSIIYPAFVFLQMSHKRLVSSFLLDHRTDPEFVMDALPLY